jgi:hypothetical protein
MMRSEVSWSELDYFVRWVLTILLGVVCYRCFNFICFVICECVFVIFTFTVFCLCTYLYCFAVILLFYVFLCFIVFFCFYSSFVYFVLCTFVSCTFVFVCTSVGLLPPGESPIAVSNNNIIYININTSVQCSHVQTFVKTFDWNPTSQSCQINEVVSYKSCHY